jgi:hypothetical protein
VKEEILSSMADVKTIQVSVVTCHQCRYTSEYLEGFCRENRHHFTRSNATKRVFQCSDCRVYKVTWDSRMPVDACSYVRERDFSLPLALSQQHLTLFVLTDNCNSHHWSMMMMMTLV